MMGERMDGCLVREVGMKMLGGGASSVGFGVAIASLTKKKDEEQEQIDE